MPPHILIVEDDPTLRATLHECLTLGQYNIIEAADAGAARRVAIEQPIACAIIDLRLPDDDGLSLMRSLKQQRPHLPVIIVTADPSIDRAVAAIKEGADDYVTKPFKIDSLLDTVARVLREASGGIERAAASSRNRNRFGVDNLIGESEALEGIKRMALQVARGDTTTVLLLGESGTGKDMLARAIHYESQRVECPFMNITCTALPENLMESELFGYEKGAFTNAASQKKGLFELSDGGSVFLDEIGDMPPVLQAKLLRVLEEKAFRRIGGVEDITVDVRIIAATNQDLETRMAQSKFREDLYYRISIIPIVMPPLRERPTDVPMLAEHFLALYNQQFHRQVKPLSKQVREKLLAYHWPGNVRELRNAVERAMLLSEGDELTEVDFVLGRRSLRPQQAPAPTVLLPESGCTLEEVEKTLVEQALSRTGQNQTRAAELLGISRDQLRYKARKFDLLADQK